MMDSIRQNYLRVMEEIQSAAMNCGRSPGSIHLVVVTKGQSVQKINQVINAGARLLGENYPEETTAKIPEVVGKVDWHMIGHLQSRKVNYVATNFSMIHSIDRLEIAQKLNDHLAAIGKHMDALFEVNMSGEESKSGFAAWNENSWDQLTEKLIQMSSLSNLNFNGLMTMPPFSENPEDSRSVFKKCRQLLEWILKQSRIPSFAELSMGTSLDYRVAIQEGATYIRVGSAIMGERVYR
jgi:PLP dependent protein